MAGSSLARATPGPSDPPPGNCGVQEFYLFSFKLAAAVLLPLGMNPHAEGMFPLGIALLVAGPIVAFLAEVHELGQPSVPAAFLGRRPVVPIPPGDPGKAFAVGRVKGALV